MSGLPSISDDDSADDNLAFLRRALEAPLPASKDYVAVTLLAPIDAPEKFLRLVPRNGGFLWRSPTTGDTFAGGGTAGSIKVRGADRFRTLSRAVPRLFDRVASYAVDGRAPPPVLVGGAAFAPDGSPDDHCWKEFGEDELTLPRWGYHRLRTVATITLTVRREEISSPAQIEEILIEARQLLREFSDEPPTSLIARFDPANLHVHQTTLDEWWDYLDNIRAALRSGEYQKIVAARRAVVELEHPIEDSSFMARVWAAYPDCIHYAIRRPASTFFGATPETLFRKQGQRLETHALAGTTRIKDDPTSDSTRDIAALQSSRKDLDEHRYVVNKIASALASLTTKITHAPQPETRRVRNLIHLQTPITAELLPRTTVFDLLEALHPTPAVGGFPAREAAQWIAKNEPLARGWYSGTVGWIDANGDGEFAVSIRCGVLTPERAYVFAGAGIVEASDPAAEYAETAAKMWPILRALGAPQAGLADAAPPPLSERSIKI